MVRTTAGSVRRDLASGHVQINSKTSYSGRAGGDVVTSIDEAAQQTLRRMADRLLSPGIGLIGEENTLRRASQFASPTVVATFDPVDGTRGLIKAIEAGRELLPGECSVMLGLQADGRAAAGYVCDARHILHMALWYGRDVGQHGQQRRRH
jgi:fructose-1,6-bisphosphatase/inositol monophosphatase family enzyme